MLKWNSKAALFDSVPQIATCSTSVIVIDITLSTEIKTLNFVAATLLGLFFMRGLAAGAES